MLRLLACSMLAMAAAALGAHVAYASQLIDRNATAVTLQVSGRGDALLAYRAHGRMRHVRAWGAVNAVPPSLGEPQVAFKLDYSGRGFAGGAC